MAFQSFENTEIPLRSNFKNLTGFVINFSLPLTQRDAFNRHSNSRFDFSDFFGKKDHIRIHLLCPGGTLNQLHFRSVTDLHLRQKTDVFFFTNDNPYRGSASGLKL